MYSSEEPTQDPQLATASGQWYAVYTKSNYEKKVASQLTNRGVANYLPVWTEVHDWTDRRKVVEVPLFRGYVFARFVDSGHDRLNIEQTPGVARIVGTAGGIEPIPEGQIAAIQQLLASGLRCAPHPFLQEGDWVRVTKGPLQGVEGLFLRQKGPARLLISVSLISQSVAAEIAAEDVEVVQPGTSQHSAQNTALIQPASLRQSVA
jgi:transcription antitermination factor NusG